MAEILGVGHATVARDATVSSETNETEKLPQNCGSIGPAVSSETSRDETHTDTLSSDDDEDIEDAMSQDWHNANLTNAARYRFGCVILRPFTAAIA